jgi:predicted enzyme related to lactoylglutathione lyase
MLLATVQPMAEFNGYEPGTPCWVELDSIDPATSQGFYTDLFGWGVRPRGPADDGYASFALRNKTVAGTGPTQEEETCWTTGFVVADADGVAERVERAGGTVMQPPIEADGIGRRARLADSERAVFVVWQYVGGGGAEIANEPVSLSWNELATRDLPGAKAFYADVFGWTIEDVPMGDDDDTVVRVASRGVAGIWPIGDVLPPEVPPHWLVYFAVDDADATTARAAELGGRVLDPPEDDRHRRPVRRPQRPARRAFAAIRNE